MANIQLKIVGLGDFSSVTTQLKALQTQISNINKEIAGVGLSSNLRKQLNDIQNEFKSTMLSSGQFTAQQVKLTSETEKFGQALQSGKLKLGDYFNIITKRSADAQKSVQALATEQVKLNNSIVQQDITKSGVYNVYTPTKINELSKATEIAAAKQNIFNLAIREGSNQLINFGKNTQWAGRQLTVGLSMPVLLFGSQAMKTFQDVNAELVRMQKVYGTGLTQPTQAALDTIKTQVTGLGKELASSMGIAVKDTAAMAADLAATGKTGNDLIVATREAMRLSKLGELDTQAAMKATISLQNVYKLSTQDLSGAVNFLNAVENQTSTSLQDLVDGIPRVGPIVQQLGGSFKDTAVMMVAMKEAGVPAAQSANAIKSAIASLINPTKAAKDAFAGYNINLANIASSTKGNPVQMIMQLQTALKGLAPLAQAQLIEKLFGKFQEARIQALITNLGAVNSQTKTAFDLVNATAPQLAAVAASEMKIATESTTGKFKRAVETLKADLIPVGQKIMEVATSILNFGAKIASFFNGLPGPIKNGLGILLTLGAIAGPIIMVTGLFANLMGQVIKVGYSLWGLVDGSKKWKDLMTPAAIAGKHMTDVMNVGLLENVTAVDTLNASLARLVTSLEAVSTAMTMGTAGAVTKAEGLLLPGMPGFGKKMASGGIVPGPSGAGDVVPAMLSPGESVISAGMSKKYGPLISAIINNQVPGYATSVQLGPDGKPMNVAIGHMGLEADPALIQRMNSSGVLTNSRGNQDLNTINAAPNAFNLIISDALNRLTSGGKSGITGANAAAEFEKELAAGVDPLEKVIQLMKQFGIVGTEHIPQLQKALDAFIAKLKAPESQGGYANTRFGAPNWKDRILGRKSKAQTTAEKEGNIWGGSFEEAGWSAFQPTLAGIETPPGKVTGKRRNFADIFTSIFGTRGPGRGRSGALATSGPQVYASGNEISRLENSSLVQDFPNVTSSAFAAGGTGYAGLKTVQSTKTTAEAVVKAGDKALGNASPSVKGEESGKNYIKGIEKGIKEQAPKLWTAGKEVVGKLHTGIDEGLNNSNGQSKIQGAFTRAFGANSRIGGLMGKFSGMGMMGRMGVGMGAGMAVQMAAPLISKLPGGAEVSAAMSGASMGMTFGPWGAAAGAAIGLVSSSITHLIANEKEHEAAVKASFTASADAITMFGGSMNQATQAVYDFNRSSSQSTSSVDKIKQTVDAIGKLDKNNSLKVMGESLKGMSTASSVIGTIEQYAAAQVSAGMDPAKVKDLVQVLLTYSGQTKYLAAAQEEITKKTKDLTTATSTWLSKLYDSTGKMSILGNDYKSLSSNQKLYADGILQVVNNINSSTTSYESMQAQLQALGSDAVNTTSTINALAAALSNAGQAAAGSQVSSWGNMGLGVPEIAELLKLNSAGVKTNLPTPLKPTKENVEQYVLTPGVRELVKQQQNAPVIAAQKTIALLKEQQRQMVIQNAGDSTQIKNLQLKKDLIDKQLKAQKDITAQMSAQQSFQQSQTDIENQIRLAQASGDYLKASLLQQQKASGAADYASSQTTTGLQNQSDALGLTIAGLKETAAAAKTKAANDSQAKQIADQLSAAQKALVTAQAENTNEAIATRVTAILAMLGIGTTPGGVGSGSKSALGVGPGISKGGSVPLKELQKFGINPIVGTVFTASDEKQYKIAGVNNNVGPGLMPYAQAYLAGRAKGGPVSGNTPYMVGEKGPEIFTPGQSGGIIPNMNIGKYVGGLVSWLSKTALETVGVSPAMRLAQGKKQTNWDYLGAGTLALGGLKAGALIPKVLKPLFAIAESTDLTQNAAEAASGLKGGTSSTSNAHHTYNINVSAGSNASADDIAKVVLNTIQRNQNMVSSNRAVRP